MNERHLDPPEDEEEGMDLGDEIDWAYDQERDRLLELEYTTELDYDAHAISWHEPLTEYERRMNHED